MSSETGNGEAGPLRLRKAAVLELKPTRPFAFDSTFHKPDHFPSPDTAWVPGVRWQTMCFAGHLLGLRIEDAGPRVRVGVWAAGRLSEAVVAAVGEELSWRANLSLDLRPFERAASTDAELARVVRRRRGM